MKFAILYSILLLSVSPLFAQISDQFRYTEALPYGGWKGMRELVRNEMVYPSSAINNGEEGEVIIRFKVGEQGRILNAAIVHSISKEVDEEAMRIFKKILWTPATKNDEVLEMEKTVKIPFHINKYKKWTKKRGYVSLPYPDLPVDDQGRLIEAKDASEPPHAIFKSEAQTVQGFIAKNLIYPEEAFRRNIHGSVKLQFVVEAHGNISNVRAVKSLGGGCTEEAIRILNLINWYPGVYEGKLIRSLMELDVTFRLQ